MSGTSEIWALLVTAALLVAFYWSLDRRPEINKVGYEIRDPIKRKSQYTFGAAQLIGQAYQKFKNEIFAVDTAQGMKLVLPFRLLEEVVANPAFSFHASLSEDLLLDYTYMGGVDHEPLSLFRRHITPNLACFLPDFQKYIDKTLADALGDYKEWTEIIPYPNVLKMIAVMTARVMMSKSAPHDSIWITITTEYVLSATKYAHELKQWPKFLYPFVYRFLPQYQAVQEQLAEARRIVLRELADIRHRQETGIKEPSPPSMLYHLTQNSEWTTPKGVEELIKCQMNLAVGGIHTTSSILTQCLYEMAAHPEYVIELRAEVQAVLQQHGTLTTKQALWELQKLDSFMRETHRLNSPNLTTIQRQAITSTTLSDGFYIPKGRKLELATFAIHRDEDFYTDAESFDGFRFYRMREQASTDDNKKHNYVTTRKDFLGWGLGRSACPGRFLADVEIKLVLSYILLRYDIKNPDGATRAPHVYFENQVYANPIQPILLRSVS